LHAIIDLAFSMVREPDCFGFFAEFLHFHLAVTSPTTLFRPSRFPSSLLFLCFPWVTGLALQQLWYLFPASFTDFVKRIVFTHPPPPPPPPHQVRPIPIKILLLFSKSFPMLTVASHGEQLFRLFIMIIQRDESHGSARPGECFSLPPLGSVGHFHFLLLEKFLLPLMQDAIMDFFPPFFPANSPSS